MNRREAAYPANGRLQSIAGQKPADKRERRHHQVRRGARLRPLNEEPLWNAAQLAEVLGVKVSWVYNRVRMKGMQRLPHLKVGKYLRFTESMVREWLEAFLREAA